MKPVVAGALLGGIALVAGILWQDRHVRLRAPAQAADQAVLDHRDSAYTSMTWVASPSDGYLQLRFFDKIEGGWSLRPTWTELRAQASADPRLAHLVPSGSAPAPATPGPQWPSALPAPDPGTLPTSAYVRFFPIGVLLNQRLMTAAAGDAHRAAPRILVVGLGSGVGIGVLAHHFPQAAITVVDIDQRVVDMVTDHVPLLRWLTTQRTTAGDARLRLVAKDARQFMRFDARREANPYDLVILDAYTAGSTIPSHLMTREFFAQAAAAMAADGIVLGNVIGSYEGRKRQVLGGTLRSLRAAGLDSALNVPVLSWEPAGDFDAQSDRNNIVLASRSPIDARRNRAGWERLLAFIPYPELAIGSALSRQYLLSGEQERSSALVPAEAVDAVDPGLASRLRLLPPRNPKAPQYRQISISDDPTTVAAARAAVTAWAHGDGRIYGSPLGWNDASLRTVQRIEIDWVKAAREVVRVSLAAARDDGTHGAEALVGPIDGPAREGAPATWRIADAPLFTDQRPNADILNR